MQTFNLVDFLILIFLILYVASHVRDGVLVLLQKLFGFIGSIVLAFLSYKWCSDLISSHSTLSPGLSDAVAFLLLFILFQSLIHVLFGMIFRRVPIEMQRSRVSQILAVLPALLDGLILTALVLLLLVVAPILPQVKGPIEESRISKRLLSKATETEVYVDKIFGRAAEESLGFLTVKPETNESVSLPYAPHELVVDERAEAELLDLVNMERAKLGLEPLVVDPDIVLVARAHSHDMWERQYFAHVNPDDETPFDRMEAGGVKFLGAGENLALARTVERAHSGLMNSEGHKRNILDPHFKRVGIGVIDGGIYGKMFTQNFAN